MNDNSGDIEKLFRESFDSFEADVDPTIWNNISGQIGANAPVPDPASSTASVSSGAASAGAGLVKIALIAGTAGLLTFAGYKMFFDDKDVQTDVKSETEIVTEESTASVVDENTSQQSLNNDVKESSQLVENKYVEDVKAATTFEKQAATESTHQEKQVEQNQVENPQVITDNTPTDKPMATEKSVAKNSPLDDEASKKSESVVLSPEERIKQKQIFEASIYASSKSGVQPLEVHFKNNGTYADDVLWIFRDGSTDRSESTSHTFTNSGTYMVVLEIRDQNGNVSKDSLEINVSGKAHLNVPNAFTPNGDGINDAFMIESEYVQNMRCEIFDRSNNLVYSWNHLYGHWDGRDMNDNTVPPGIYFYVIEAVDNDGKKLDLKKGTVTLFR